MIDFFINGQRVDLFGNETVAMTYQCNKFQEVKSRSGEYSNTFKIPYTANNKKIAQHSHQPNSIGDFARKKNTVKIYENGVLVVDGFCKIVTSKDEININVFSGNSNWIDSIGDKQLQSIDLSQYDHMFFNDVINDNRLNTSGFVYANCHYGNTVDFYPSIYYRTLLDSIFAEYGYTIAGSLLGDPLFQRSVLPFCNKQWMKRFGTTFFDADFRKVTNELITTGDGIAFASLENTRKLKPTNAPLFFIRNSEWDGVGSGFFTAFDFGSTKTVNAEGYLLLELPTSFSGTGTVTVSLEDINPVTSITPQILGTSSYFGSGNIYVQLSYTNLVFDFATSYRIRVNFGNTSVNQFSCLNGYLKFDDGLDEIFPQQRDQHTDLALSLPPKLKIKDFIKHVFNQFGVQVTTDYENGVIILNKFDDVSEKDKAIDVSNLVDASERPEIEYNFGNYAQNNYMRYKEDNNDSTLPIDYGTGNLKIDNELLPVESELFKSEFAGVVRAVVGGITMATYPLFTTTQQLTPRCAYIVQNNENLFNISGQPALATNSHLFFDDFHFDALIDRNYKLIKAVMFNQKIIKLNLRLNNVHVCQISSSTPFSKSLNYNRSLYINTTIDDIHINGYFYLNSINQYKIGQNESTETELCPID
jgi:hypothetical protein